MSETFNNTLQSLFKGMDAYLSSKTVVGEPIHIGDTIILPLVDVAFGVGAGAYGAGKDDKNSAGGGMGGKMTPSAVLVIQGDKIKLVNIKNQDSITKIIDLVPEFLDKFTPNKTDKTDKSVVKKAAKEMEDILADSVPENTVYPGDGSYE